MAPYLTGGLVALSGVLLYGTLAPQAAAPDPARTWTRPWREALASVTPPPAFSEFVYQAVQPSLVLIQTKGPPGRRRPDGEGGLGSGVVVNLDGDILTSLHVVADATEIKLTFADGTKSPGRDRRQQPEHDIAVIRATRPPANLRARGPRRSRRGPAGQRGLRDGQPVRALRLDERAASSPALDRSFQLPDSDQVLTGLFQIDAAVNPGNSGGALTDRDGHVIGIVTALVNPTEEDVFIGIGLAVPIDVAGGAAGLPPY